MADERRLYDVYLSYPVMQSRAVYEAGKATGEFKEYESRTNVQAAVLAADLDEVLALVRTEYPTGSIWNITHRGNRVVLTG